MTVHHPDKPDAGTNLALLDMAAGHFSRVEYRSGGTLPGSLISEFAYIARDHVNRIQRERRDDNHVPERRHPGQKWLPSAADRPGQGPAEEGALLSGGNGMTSVEVGNSRENTYVSESHVTISRVCKTTDITNISRIIVWAAPRPQCLERHTRTWPRLPVLTGSSAQTSWAFLTVSCQIWILSFTRVWERTFLKFSGLS